METPFEKADKILRNLTTLPVLGKMWITSIKFHFCNASILSNKFGPWIQQFGDNSGMANVVPYTAGLFWCLLMNYSANVRPHIAGNSVMGIEGYSR